MVCNRHTYIHNYTVNKASHANQLDQQPTNVVTMVRLLKILGQLSWFS